MSIRLLAALLLIACSSALGGDCGEPVVIEWKSVTKCDFAGETGKVFKPRIFEITWDKSDAVRDKFEEKDIYGLLVTKSGTKPLDPPVRYSAKNGEIGYSGLEEVLDTDSDKTKVWGHEYGQLVLDKPVLSNAEEARIATGSRMQLRWSRMLYLSHGARAGDIPKEEDALMPLPGTDRIAKVTDLGHDVDVRGQLGKALGTVCRIKGKWDIKVKNGLVSKQGMFFYVDEVDGKPVKDVEWMEGEIVRHHFRDGSREVLSTGDVMRHRGEVWTLEGCEVGRYAGSPDGYPVSGGISGVRKPGFYTGFTWWKKVPNE